MVVAGARARHRPGLYQDMAAQWTIPGCNEPHCFRLLVPWTVGRLPGPAVVKWRGYAVIMNVVAGAGVAALCLTWGLSRRVAVMAATASVFGFGSLYTLHDSFTADPLMFAIGPWLVWLLERQQLRWAALVALAGVTAKEFAAAPVYVFAGATWLRVISPRRSGCSPLARWSLRSGLAFNCS